VIDLKKTAVFTIASKNYFAQVKTLMASLKQYQPEWDRYVVLVDELEEEYRGLIIDTTLYTLISARELPIPSPYKMFFRYTILELNTAVKPWGFEKLLMQDGYDAVIYLDPDIVAYRDMHELDKLMETDGAIVLTPHITAPIWDDKKPGELNILQGGVYNLGFIAVSKGVQTAEYIRWWESKLEYDCVVDLPRGLFVDQKWMEYVPAMFDNVVIFKHQGYNVAYWNLYNRKCEKNGETYYFNGDPLVFFHFSGFDPTYIKPFSKHQDRFTIDTVGAVRDIAAVYAEKVISYGYKEIKDLPYAYDKFCDGTKIIDSMRRIYNSSPKLKEKLGENPFMHPDLFIEVDTSRGTGIIMSPIMEDIWNHRPDLQEAFGLYKTVHNLAYANWFVDSMEREYGLDKKFIAPIKARLEEVLSQKNNCKSYNGTTGNASGEIQGTENGGNRSVLENTASYSGKRLKKLLLKTAFFAKPFLSKVCPKCLKDKLKRQYVKLLEDTYT
jgi:hypothetical protein